MIGRTWKPAAVPARPRGAISARIARKMGAGFEAADSGVENWTTRRRIPMPKLPNSFGFFDRKSCAGLSWDCSPQWHTHCIIATGGIRRGK
jgi:hypothetical protein